MGTSAYFVQYSDGRPFLLMLLSEKVWDKCGGGGVSLGGSGRGLGAREKKSDEDKDAGGGEEMDVWDVEA